MKILISNIFLLPILFLIPSNASSSHVCGVDRIPISGCILRNDGDPHIYYTSFADGLTAKLYDADYANPIKRTCIKKEGGILGMGSSISSLDGRYVFLRNQQEYYAYEGIKDGRNSYYRSFKIGESNSKDIKRLDISFEKEVKLKDWCYLSMGETL